MKPIGTKTINTERLVLRAPQLSDAEALVRIKSLTMSVNEAHITIKKIVEELSHPFVYHWVITMDGNVIGRIKAWDVNPYNGYLQFGYDIGEEYRCCGYMSEALQAVIRFMMMEADANRVFCSVRAGNIASRRVCEKCGMILEGILRQHYARQDGSFDDVCIYGIVKDDIMED